jgi:hypothetical protein
MQTWATIMEDIWILDIPWYSVMGNHAVSWSMESLQLSHGPRDSRAWETSKGINLPCMKMGSVGGWAWWGNSDPKHMQVKFLTMVIAYWSLEKKQLNRTKPIFRFELTSTIKTARQWICVATWSIPNGARDSQPVRHLEPRRTAERSQTQWPLSYERNNGIWWYVHLCLEPNDLYFGSLNLHCLCENLERNGRLGSKSLQSLPLSTSEFH